MTSSNDVTKAYQERLRGLDAAQRHINRMIVEAQAACRPRGRRQRQTLTWWQGRYEALVTANLMLCALAGSPERNAEQIEEAFRTDELLPTDWANGPFVKLTIEGAA